MSLSRLETGRRENVTYVIGIARHSKSPSPEGVFGIDRRHLALRRRLLTMLVTCSVLLNTIRLRRIELPIVCGASAWDS